jgi:class 3 adenylate cyclase
MRPLKRADRIDANDPTRKSRMHRNNQDNEGTVMCSDLVGSTALSAQQGASLFERRAETLLEAAWRNIRGGSQP